MGVILFERIVGGTIAGQMFTRALILATFTWF